MIRLLLPLIALVVCLAASAAESKDISFTGTWGTPENSDHSFSLILTQEKDQITGYHIAVAHHGNRLDSILPNEGTPSITGTITDGVAHVKFRSGYSDARGEATITLRENEIDWRIIKSSVGHYFPDTATLYREK